ncbi:MAG: cobalamin-dependent protein [Clostridiales Family XIII bacterium]|jgi:methanogenic corrinoid protein MtbC1|nr:cobalamin-dependent protein [Clostridiales Family XIII bacterium]
MLDTEELKAAVGDLDSDHLTTLLDGLLVARPTEDEARQVLEACQQGMDIVGARFVSGQYFVGDLVFAGAMLSGAVEKLKPLLGFAGDLSAGTVVLGTVEGDIHFIGKNLFGTMLEAANFRVIDIGIDQPPKAFLNAAQKYRADIVGLSGLLTTAVDSMKETVEALAGLRRGTKIIIGGDAVSEKVCKYVGADAWSKNAYEAVQLCRSWVERKK